MTKFYVNNTFRNIYLLRKMVTQSILILPAVCSILHQFNLKKTDTSTLIRVLKWLIALRLWAGFCIKKKNYIYIFYSKLTDTSITLAAFSLPISFHFSVSLTLKHMQFNTHSHREKYWSASDESTCAGL